MLFYSDVTENEFIKKVEDEILEEGFIVRINQFSSTPDELVTIDFYHEDEPLETTVYTYIDALTVDECVNDIILAIKVDECVNDTILAIRSL